MFIKLVKGTMIVAGLASLAVAAIAAALCLTDDELFDDPEELFLDDKPIHDVLPGDMVQWDSGGTLIFPEPKAVVRIEKSEKMGTYVFVEGSNSGIPIDQIVPMS